ncbi:MAG: hypothetical protein ACM3ZT_07480 [Bacillota bacterium]
MSKTNLALLAVILALAGSFAWYASKHPAGAQIGVPASTTGSAPETADVMPRTLSADVDGAGLTKLALDVGVGEMHVNPSPDAEIHVRVTLRPKEQEFLWFFHWMSQGTAHGIAAASLRQEKQDGKLSLSLDYPRTGNQDNVKQEWDVQMPAKLALDASLKVGELTIEGVAGGVAAQVNVGELSIDTPKGPIEGEVNVGEIRAKSQSSEHGKISLSSNIGETVLYIGGKQSGYHEHGGLGNTVTADGDGPDGMHLGVNVGEASLRINPADGQGHP